MLIRDGNDILGVAGTGLDLTAFIREVVENDQPGITSLFVDHVGAIQVYRDEKLIDFAASPRQLATTRRSTCCLKAIRTARRCLLP